MKSLGMIEVYGFTTAVCVADVVAKTADVKIVALDRNRPLSADAPAPLIMIVKIEGDTSSVQSAVESGVEYAKSTGMYVVSHIISRPDEMTENMAYLLDINKDKFNKKLPKNLKNYDYPEKGCGCSVGLLEVQGLVASIEGLDSMLKTANVRLVHTEKRLGGRLVTLVVKGSVSEVSASVANGEKAASVLGKVYGKAVIANPHREITKFFDMDIDEE